MLAARDILILARRTAGLSQKQLADRLGRPQSTIARWELGEMEPSYAAVTTAVDACGLSASVNLATRDWSYLHDVREILRLKPPERLRKLGGEARVVAARRLAAHNGDGVLFGDVAAALSGWPLSLPYVGPFELCGSEAVSHALVDVDVDVEVVERPPGTRGLSDLQRDRERVAIGDGLRLWVASPLDLLRIERARLRYVEAGALEALVEHRRRWPAGPPPPREYTDQEAAEAIEKWLSRAG
ncbi:MAG TPA: helix-turn-helix transcriptional regulator [Solirubrobacteraceae bacterium]